MPFNPRTFQDNLEGHIPQATRDALVQACTTCATLTTPQQKAHCIKEMIDRLDREVDELARRTIMEACGRQCIGASILVKARQIAQAAHDLDDLLEQLNRAHIGGGHLQREGDVVHAAYDRCYCGSVSKTRELFSATYCHCSCGWYGQLFETLLGKPVKVELLGSILQGDERCRFLIRINETAGHT